MQSNYRPDKWSVKVYPTVLVESDITLGNKVLDALAHAHIPVAAALWLYVPQVEEWHLIIATPLVDKKGPRSAYGEVWNILGSRNLLPDVPFRKLFLVTSKSAFISGLRNKFRTTRSRFPSYLRSAYVGDRFVEDAYIYPVPTNH